MSQVLHHHLVVDGVRVAGHPEHRDKEGEREEDKHQVEVDGRIQSFKHSLTGYQRGYSSPSPLHLFRSEESKARGGREHTCR